MRIAILGGTRFVGRAIAERLDAAGHELLLVHRGNHQPPELGQFRHAYADRDDGKAVTAALKDFRPDGLVDVSGENGQHADAGLAGVHEDTRVVLISSGDVYRAFQSLHDDVVTDPVPLDEHAPLRERASMEAAGYDNLGLEERYLARGGVALRLAAVYGEHDYQRRFEFVLGRLRAGRDRIPIGSGSFLFSKVYVGDVAAAVELALASKLRGEVFNLAERTTASYRLFAQQILELSGSQAELVTVPDELLPDGLWLTGLRPQHLQLDAAKARKVLAWTETDQAEAMARSIQWHLDNPPTEETQDWSADDAALAAAEQGLDLAAR